MSPKTKSTKIKPHGTVPFTFVLPAEHLAALRDLSRRSGLSLATLVRRSVALTLDDTTRAIEAFEPPRR